METCTQVEFRSGQDLTSLEHSINWWLADNQANDKSFVVKNISFESTSSWATVMVTYTTQIEWDNVGDPILKRCSCHHCDYPGKQS